MNLVSLHGALVLGMGAAFLLDALTPPGVADGIVYPVLLSLCLLVPSHRALLAYSVLPTVLTGIPALIPPKTGARDTPLLNHPIPIAPIRTTLRLTNGPPP